VDNPTKHPQYLVLFFDVPTRIEHYSVEFPSVTYLLYSAYPGAAPFITYINAGTLADCTNYVNKLAYFAASAPPGKLIISASAGGYGNTNYYFDDTEGGYDGKGLGMAGVQAVLQAGVSSNSIAYTNVYPDCGSLACHLTNGTNPAGYFCWGIHSALGGDYATNGAVQWSGQASWWIIATIESYNGRRNTSHGSFVKWLSPNAFGGTDYSNTPVGALSNVEEPYLPTTHYTATYFGLWAAGKSFAFCAWNARHSPYFQAIGDPLITK